MAKKLRFPSLPASHPFNRHPPGRGRRRRRNPGRSAVHTAKFDRCVQSVKASGYAKSPYAVCTASLGERGAIKAAHRRRRNPRRATVPEYARRKPRYWMIQAFAPVHPGERRGARGSYMFAGDRFTSAMHGWVRFPERAMAQQWAHHLVRSFPRQLKRWRVRVVAGPRV